jgi:hypothetical protein
MYTIKQTIATPNSAAIRTLGEKIEVVCNSAGRCAPSVMATEMEPGPTVIGSV